ncbi:hypothetical protein K491DRAFT_692062 [Lophiostoma macrostomum CBS 122681]|uniref:F-box domain-containing protein n=1 Tax=Lophiostoma macrostomum CBS 122681 TaxID=1314788 RepID=A0A6A6TCK9_9PLEO|nr:hypothetical protein K491DRAFT_692062 [Lophiostoma macrostomum CBS 122681]
MPALDTLPNEILSLITAHLDHPKDVSNVALACRRLSGFVELDGWKAYMKGRFGGITGPDADAKEAVHGLTTLYRNWQRKAFIARYIEPTRAIRLTTWDAKQWRGNQGQTMGYRPSIDSYEEISGWADRREVLAWSAGTQIALRIKETGQKAVKARNDVSESRDLDEYKHVRYWYSYQIPRGREGQDDITALKLLRPFQKVGATDCIAVGTASGQLRLLSVDTDDRTLRVQSYSTQRRPVVAISVSPDQRPVMTTVLGDDTLALYSIEPLAESARAKDSLSQVQPVPSGRVWSCNFISKDKVAVGMGPTTKPIQIFEITPTGFSAEPLRRFSLDSRSGSEVARLNTSVYPIVPLPASSRGGALTGHTFLSGGYDGIVRLHDLRSPHDFETMFWDVTSDSSIYSLATQGLERIVVGTSQHSMLKVFDLRLSGSHAYHSVALPPQERRSAAPKTRDYASNEIVSEAVNHIGVSTVSGGWNLFLHPRNLEGDAASRRRRTRVDDTPIYSLSIPSSTSTSLYAGLEGSVMSLDFLSILDKHPDPLHRSAVVRFPNTDVVDVKSSYNPHGDVLDLGMYEQGSEDAVGMRLMVQGGVGVEQNIERNNNSRSEELDDRWKDPSTEKNRWSRGQQPHGRGGGGHRRGRGGRGRGRQW